MSTLRPNQIFAVSLPFPLLDGDDADDGRRAPSAASLLTPYGLRSLSPDDPAYRGDYGGDQFRRDGAYHQGPVWTWLIGAYVEAHARVHGDRAAALDLLRPFAHHLRDAGLGSISEILEGDAPAPAARLHRPGVECGRGAARLAEPDDTRGTTLNRFDHGSIGSIRGPDQRVPVLRGGVALRSLQCRARERVACPGFPNGSRPLSTDYCLVGVEATSRR